MHALTSNANIRVGDRHFINFMYQTGMVLTVNSFIWSKSCKWLIFWLKFLLWPVLMLPKASKRCSFDSFMNCNWECKLKRATISHDLSVLMLTFHVFCTHYDHNWHSFGSNMTCFDHETGKNYAVICFISLKNQQKISLFRSFVNW